MTPLKVTPSQARRLERNLTGQGRAKKKPVAPRRVIIHIAPDVRPETVAALAALAMRVKGMGEGELREFIKMAKRKQRDAVES